MLGKNSLLTPGYPKDSESRKVERLSQGRARAVSGRMLTMLEARIGGAHTGCRDGSGDSPLQDSAGDVTVIKNGTGVPAPSNAQSLYTAAVWSPPAFAASTASCASISSRLSSALFFLANSIAVLV